MVFSISKVMKSYNRMHSKVGFWLSAVLVIWMGLPVAIPAYAQNGVEPQAEETNATNGRVNEGERTADDSSDVAGIRSLLQTLNLQAKSMDWRGNSLIWGNLNGKRFEKYLNSPPLTTENDLT